MKKSRLICAHCAVMVSLITVSANAALVSRLGGAAAYDNVLDITWLTDAGLSGAATWNNQIAWVSSLNTANYLGFNDWRLASMSVAAGLPTGTTTSVIDCRTATEQACRDNELAYMYHYNLGGKGTGNPRVGNQTVGDVTLTNIQLRYWSSTERSTSFAWFFDNSGGGDNPLSSKGFNIYGWAVRAGDVSTVPVPAAVWLFGSGLIGLIGVAKYKKTV